jgi:hypothetical protein
MPCNYKYNQNSSKLECSRDYNKYCDKGSIYMTDINKCIIPDTTCNICSLYDTNNKCIINNNGIYDATTNICKARIYIERIRPIEKKGNIFTENNFKCRDGSTPKILSGISNVRFSNSRTDYILECPNFKYDATLMKLTDNGNISEFRGMTTLFNGVKLDNKSIDPTLLPNDRADLYNTAFDNNSTDGITDVINNLTTPLSKKKYNNIQFMLGYKGIICPLSITGGNTNGEGGYVPLNTMPSDICKNNICKINGNKKNKKMTLKNGCNIRDTKAVFLFSNKKNIELNYNNGDYIIYAECNENEKVTKNNTCKASTKCSVIRSNTEYTDNNTNSSCFKTLSFNPLYKNENENGNEICGSIFNKKNTFDLNNINCNTKILNKQYINDIQKGLFGTNVYAL